jgi:hypothetical protein
MFPSQKNIFWHLENGNGFCIKNGISLWKCCVSWKYTPLRKKWADYNENYCYLHYTQCFVQVSHTLYQEKNVCDEN